MFLSSPIHKKKSRKQPGNPARRRQLDSATSQASVPSVTKGTERHEDVHYPENQSTVVNTIITPSRKYIIRKKQARRK